MMTPGRHLTIWVGAVFVLLVLVSPAAKAGSPEEFVSVAIGPGEPSFMVLRYQNAGDGLFYGDSAGKSWRMLCGSAIDPTVFRSGGPVGVAGDGTVVMGTTLGIWEGDATGCVWKHFPLEGDEGVWITDVVPHPADPGVLFAISSRNAPGERNGVWRRSSDGIWSRSGTADETVLFHLRVTDAGSNLRFYESAVRADGENTYVPLIRVSDDEGQTWQEFSTQSFDGTVSVEGIDPTNADRIVASQFVGSGGTKILVSSDRGETFFEYADLDEFGAIAFAPDGRLWIGDATGGLWHAPSLDEAPIRIADFRVRCLNYSATEVLYACQPWAFGTVVQQSGEFQTLLEMRAAPALVSCDARDMAAACKPQLCSGFCKIGHFPQAPLCCGYEDPSCGPMQLDPADRRCDDDGPAPVDEDGGGETPSDADAGRNHDAGPMLAPRRAGRGCAFFRPAPTSDEPWAIAFGVLVACLGIARARSAVSRPLLATSTHRMVPSQTRSAEKTCAKSHAHR